MTMKKFKPEAKKSFKDQKKKFKPESKGYKDGYKKSR